MPSTELAEKTAESDNHIYAVSKVARHADVEILYFTNTGRTAGPITQTKPRMSDMKKVIALQMIAVAVMEVSLATVRTVRTSPLANMASIRAI